MANLNIKNDKERKLNRNSLYILIIYLLLPPFNLADGFSGLFDKYADLFWVTILLWLTLLYSIKKTSNILSVEIMFVCIWVIYLFSSYLFANHHVLYEMSGYSYATYNIRFLLQYTPVFFLLVTRGLSKGELILILYVVVVITPLSIIKSYYDYNIKSIDAFQDFVNSSIGISYNTYLPYTTYPLFASVYLLSNIKKRIFRIPVIISFIFILIFIFTNPSRQSVLFVIISLLIYIIMSKSYKNIFLIVMAFGVLTVFLEKANLMDFVINRFFSEKATETTRNYLMMSALSSIKGLPNIIIGNGLELSLYINPHNNYIFTVMRNGIVGLLLLFMPYFISLYKAVLSDIRYNKEAWFDRSLSYFVIISILFTLFHSFFGYPHIDPLNAPYVWFGLGVVINYNRILYHKYR